MDTVRRDASFLRRRRPMSTRRLIHLRCGHARRAVLALAMAAGAAAAGPVFAPYPSDFPVHGVDVSHHQGPIDWAMVAREPGQRFAYLKATQGRAHVDPEFARNWRGARAAGLKVGAYHYFSFCSGAAAQARLFLSVVPRAADALPAVLDVEHLLNCAPAPDVDKVRASLRLWLTRVERATGKRPIVYATADVLNEFFLGSDLDYPLWVRATPEDPEPVLQLPWLIWQYDDQHTLSGLAGTVDRDVFTGDATGLLALSNLPARRRR
jgi:lysozyme